MSSFVNERFVNEQRSYRMRLDGFCGLLERQPEFLTSAEASTRTVSNDLSESA